MIMIIIPVVFHNECKFQQFQRVTSESTYRIRIVAPNNPLKVTAVRHTPERIPPAQAATANTACYCADGLHRYIYHPLFYAQETY